MVHKARKEVDRKSEASQRKHEDLAILVMRTKSKPTWITTAQKFPLKVTFENPELVATETASSVKVPSLDLVKESRACITTSEK